MFVDGIAIKRKHRGAMEVLGDKQVISISEENGLEGDYRGKRGKSGWRQVTIVSAHQWEKACRSLNISRPWFYRRANLCITDYLFSPADQGRTLAAGTRVLLQITGELDPCERMDEIFYGLKDALMPDWRGGVTCRVLRGGEIKCGDKVSFVASE
jgi:MOSC domain-containing protein YiiM